MRCRKSLSFAEWPVVEQALWNAVFDDDDLDDEAGAGSHLRPVTRKLHEQHWGRWLMWLAARDELNEGPAYSLLTNDRLLEFWASIRNLAPNTQAMIFQTIEQCANWMAPGTDWRWLKKIRAKIRKQQHRRRDKRPLLVEADQLAVLGMELMAEAREGAGALPIRHLTRFRDGLMIALLAGCALRLRNLTGIELDTHLRHEDDGYWLVFEAEEMKNGEAFETDVPAWLNEGLEEYVSGIRPALLSGRQETALWITKDGEPMPYWSVQKQIKVHTRKKFGHAIYPHLFRDCVATSIAMASPSRIRTAQDVLGHRSFKTTEEHYIHADRRKSVRAYHALLQKRARNRRLHKEHP